MLARDRIAAIFATALLLVSGFLALLASPTAATAGRDSPAAAADGTIGAFEGLYDFSSYVDTGPPLAEDWYKYFVTEGQIFQAAMIINPGGSITIYHTNAVDGITQSFAVQQRCCIRGVPVRLATVDLFVWTTETIYIKVSPAAGATAGSEYYNLYMRAYNATEIPVGGSVTPPSDVNAIQGWLYPYLVPRYVSDFFWLNVSDAVGTNHQAYRAQLTQTCTTAMYDLTLYQFVDYPNKIVEYLNHSYALERRNNRVAMTTAPETVDFSPVLYDGKYLLQVFAAENGSFSAFPATARYTYTIAFSAVGGFLKDDNDHRGEAVWVNTSAQVSGRIDGRDDSGDWFRVPLLQGDQAAVSVTFNRENNEIVTLGQRYRGLVFDPNGTAIADEYSWAVVGNTVVYNPSLYIPSFTAAMNGTYYFLVLTADGAIDFDTQWNNAVSNGYGRSYADYVVNFGLPNRKPVQDLPLPDLIMNEEESKTINLGPYFHDPERKFGYPTFGVSTSQNFSFILSGGNLTATPKPDWNGVETVTISVRDDVPANTIQVPLRIVVDPVNDAPRVWAGASASWTTLTISEDTETTIPLRSIFYDIDDIDLSFTAGGVSGGHLTVLINPNSQIVTITPDPNWNGQQDITWTATDNGSLTAEFTTTVVVRPVNDPPRATDRRLERIVFNEGSEATVDLSGEFFDLDGDVLRYYGFIDDSRVAQYVRINNSLLTPTDPVMRIYVVDAYRADYFTDGPVQVRFQAWDTANNSDPAQGGQSVVVEKTTFLEILNVNDPPYVDDFTPRPEEVNLTQWHEGDTITFSVTSVKDADAETQFFYKWFVNDDEVPQEVSPTFVFKTVLDKTRPGQYDEGSYKVSVQVFDAANAKAVLEPTWTFEVLKTNRAPSITVVRPTAPSFEEGTRIDFSALASDEDPEDAGLLNITWTYADAHGNPVLLGTGQAFAKMLDPGTYAVTVRVTDGIEPKTASFTITVAEHKFSTPGFDLGAAAAGLAIAGALLSPAARRRKSRR